MIQKFRITLIFIMLVICAGAQTIPEPIQLVNGWKLSPVGKSFPLGDLPLNLSVSKSSKYMAVTNNGQGIQSIQLIDLKTEKNTEKHCVKHTQSGIRNNWQLNKIK